MIVVNHQFSQTVLINHCLMGWGPVHSSQNRSYNRISEKIAISLHISNTGFNVKILQGSEIFVYQKQDRSQSSTLSSTTKNTLFWWVGDQLTHLRTKVTTKSVKKDCDLTTYIRLGPKCQNSPWLRNLCIQNMIVVNHWFSQTVLNKNCVDGLGTCSLISEKKLQTYQWKNSNFTTYIKLGL